MNNSMKRDLKLTCFMLLCVFALVFCVNAGNSFAPEPEVQVVKQHKASYPIISLDYIVETPVRERVESVIPADLLLIEEEIIEEEQYELWIEELCSDRAVDPDIVKAMVYHESRFNGDAFSQAAGEKYYGLMQINPRWQKARMKELGVTDLQDPYSNLKVGVDYISDLAESTGDVGYALMLYSMNNADAAKLYKQGKLNNYAKVILSTANDFREEVA